MSLTSRLLPLALVLACGPEMSGTLNTSSITDPTEGPPDSTATSPGTTAEEPTTTAAASTGDEPTACAPGPHAGDLECVPPGETENYFVFDFQNPPEEWSWKFDQLCDVDAVTDDGTLQQLGLVCPDGQVSIDLYTSVPHVSLDLAMGAKVRLRYEHAMDGEARAETFILLDETDLPLAAGVQTPFLPVTLDPLAISLIASDCDGLGDRCAVVQRTGVHVTFGDASVTVFDSNTATLPATPPLEVLVGHSTDAVCIDPDCGFHYSPWSTAALIVRSPG